MLLGKVESIGEYKSGKNLSLEKSCLFSLKCEMMWVHTSEFPLLGLSI